MEQKDRVAQTATEALRQIYEPKVTKMLEDAMHWEKYIPPLELSWYEKLIRRYRIHMYNYCEALAGLNAPYQEYYDY
jgi:hypothetical protein